MQQRADQLGSYKRTGVLVLVYKDTVESSDRLVELNLCLWSMWAALQLS